MAQCLKLSVVHAKDLSSVPGTHTVAYNTLQLHFQGIWSPLLTSAGTSHVRVHIQGCRQSTGVHQTNAKI